MNKTKLFEMIESIRKEQSIKSGFTTQREEILKILKDNNIIAKVRDNRVDLKHDKDFQKTVNLIQKIYPSIGITYGYY
jgi:hypothetical protein